VNRGVSPPGLLAHGDCTWLNGRHGEQRCQSPWTTRARGLHIVVEEAPWREVSVPLDYSRTGTAHG
jgi:hypothetical protein